MTVSDYHHMHETFNDAYNGDAYKLSIIQVHN